MGVSPETTTYLPDFFAPPWTLFSAASISSFPLKLTSFGQGVWTLGRRSLFFAQLQTGIRFASEQGFLTDFLRLRDNPQVPNILPLTSCNDRLSLRGLGSVFLSSRFPSTRSLDRRGRLVPLAPKSSRLWHASFVLTLFFFFKVPVTKEEWEKDYLNPIGLTKLEPVRTPPKPGRHGDHGGRRGARWWRKLLTPLVTERYNGFKTTMSLSVLFKPMALRMQLLAVQNFRN